MNYIVALEDVVSIYETLGQEHGIVTAVHQFYERVLADRELARYFDGVDINRLRRHQAKLLSAVTGGPAEYQGRDLGKAHDHLGISNADFDRVVSHLAATLADLGIDAPTIGSIGDTLARYQDDIVTSVAPVG